MDNLGGKQFMGGQKPNQTNYQNGVVFHWQGSAKNVFPNVYDILFTSRALAGNPISGDQVPASRVGFLIIVSTPISIRRIRDVRSGMYQWRKFEFFEEKLAGKCSIPEEVAGKIECCSSGRGKIVLGCDDGTVSFLDRGLKFNYGFQAHSSSVLFVQQLKVRLVL